MTRLTESLIGTCRDQLLREKWLVSPSLRIGYQWLDTVARAAQPVLNVRIKTFRSMALELAAAELASRELQLLPASAGPILVDRVFRRLQRKGLSYLGDLTATTGLAEVVYHSIDAIRVASLAADDIVAQDFEVELKGQDVRIILEEYLRELAHNRMVDYADTLRLAATCVQNDPHTSLRDVLLLLPEDMNLNAGEQRLLDVFPGDQILSLPVDQPVGESDPPEPLASDASLLSWLRRPADAPEPAGDGSVEFFAAIGEVNEVREVLRRVTSTGARLDQVEVLYSDAEAYVPLIYETLAGLASDDTHLDDLPVTFAEGIPARFFRPGRLLSTWVAWINEGFPQARLVSMIREGLLAPPGPDASKCSYTRLATVLRHIGIGFDKSRYLTKIDEEIEARRRRLDSSESTEDLDETEIEELKQRTLRHLEELQLLRDLTEALLEASPSQDAPARSVLDAARKLLKTVCRSVSKSDAFARERLLEDIDDLCWWLDEEQATGHNAWDWLAALPGQARVLGSGPRPGCLHAASLATGGHSGRFLTFIIGLDDSRFPGSGSQDPLLLDDERRKISEDLPTAPSVLEEKILGFCRLLARLRGKVVLSFSARDVIDDREKFPSSLLIAAYRIVSGNHAGTQTEFFDWLPSPASFAPARDDCCLSTNEWWLHQLCCGDPVQDASALVEKAFPHLGRGREALQARHSDNFTPYDGLVAIAGNDLDPLRTQGPVMSSHRLELIGRCPLAFFFEQGLEIEPPEELELDPARWLDPLAYGSLLHEVFEQFGRYLIHGDRKPEYPADLPRLDAILDSIVEVYRDAYPPPSEHAYQAQLTDMKRAVRTFLVEDALNCHKERCQPVYVEASLGMRSQDEPSTIDTEDPVSIRLPNGSSLRVRGRVDRIDRVGPTPSQSFMIWDYKTGSAWKYREGDPFRQGRVVQSAVYVAMVTRRLKEVVSPKAKVLGFGFFFPGTRERGRRIPWTTEQLAGGTAVIAQLIDAVRAGAFLATNEEGGCKFCPYAAICGDAKQVSVCSTAKLEQSENTILQPIRELRGDGET